MELNYILTMSNDGEQSHPMNTGRGWDERYSRNVPSVGAGTGVHSVKGNILFYKTKFKAVDKCIMKVGTTLYNAIILDAAGGEGNFVEFFLKRKCKKLVVSDFSQAGLSRVSERYKDDSRISTQLFDLSSKTCPWNKQFDFVFVMEAIFLLPDDEAFLQAIGNLSAALKKGGYLIVTDLYSEKTIKVNAYVTYRSRDIYQDAFKKYGLKEVATVPQTVVFNRILFRRFQKKVEQMGNFMYWLDQIALAAGLRSPKKQDVQYIISKKMDN